MTHALTTLARCRWSPGATSLEVEDWDQPGTTVTLPLDAKESAVEAAEKLYARARKVQRGAATVQPLLEAARSQIQQLRETRVLLEQLEVPADAGVLKEVQVRVGTCRIGEPVRGSG